MDTKQFVMALCTGASALAMSGCATSGKVVLRTDEIYPPIGPYSQMVGYGNQMQDLNEFAGMNAVYGQYFQKDPPARAKVEIAVIAGRR